MRSIITLLIATTAVFLGGCGSEPGQGTNLEKVEAQPAADLEAGAKAQTIDEWAAANPNNGAPGSGEQGAGK